MRKVTLQFTNLTELAAFSKTLKEGFIINTCNLTLTTTACSSFIHVAISEFNARQIPVSDRVFTYFQMN